MTLYGGEIGDYGQALNGFFVSCAKCGWHSRVEVFFKDEIGFKSIVFNCEHCGNRYEMEIE